MKPTSKIMTIAALAAFTLAFAVADEPIEPPYPDEGVDDCQVYQDNYESALAESFAWLEQRDLLTQQRDTLSSLLDDLLSMDPFDPLVSEIQSEIEALDAEIEEAESWVNWYFGWAQYWEARYFDEGC